VSDGFTPAWADFKLKNIEAFRQAPALGRPAPAGPAFYLALKNLVLWARSEAYGSAENLKSAYVWLAG